MGDAPFLLGLVVAVAVLASAGLARVLEVPYPVFLVLAGLVASFVPGAPTFSLSPEIVFYLFLPPLVYHAAFLSSPRAMRANGVPIGLLAVGLTLLTTFAVAGAAAAVVPGVGLALAVTLGAVVGPTDPVAATAVMERLGAPRRLSVVLEGESLVNDGVALVIYSIAVSAATSGSFSVGHGLLRFVEVVAGGIAWGLALGWVLAKVRTRIKDAGIELTLSLVTPFIAYIPADRAHVSGVLATVTVGLFLGSRSAGLFTPRVRLQAYAFWGQLDFLLNSVLFVLLGLQFRHVLAIRHGQAAGTLVAGALAVVAVVIGVRLLVPYLIPRRFWPADPGTWRQRTLVGWAGMRGAISLAAALAVPYDVAGGRPARAAVLFLTFTVIVATLVVQGTTLPFVVRRLGLSGASGDPRELEARLAMLDAALDRLDELGEQDGAPPELVGALRQRYEQAQRLVQSEGAAGEAEAEREQRRELREFRRLQRQLVQAQRRELNRRYRDGKLALEEVRRLRRDLDLQESLLD